MSNSARPRPSRGAAAARGRCTRPLHAHHALLTCSEAGKRGNAPKQAPRSGRRAPPGAPKGQPPRARSPAPPSPPCCPPLSVDPPRPRRGSGATALTLRRYLLPEAAAPTHHPGLRGWRRLAPRLSHEAPRAPCFGLPPPRPPALRPHPRRWSRDGRQGGSTFAALAAQGVAFLLNPTPSVSFSRDPSSPQKTPQPATATTEIPGASAQTPTPRWRPGLAAARFPQRVPARGRAGACPQRRARERARVGRAHARARTAPRCWGLPPPGSRSVSCLPARDVTGACRRFSVWKPKREGWS